MLLAIHHCPLTLIIIILFYQCTADICLQYTISISFWKTFICFPKVLLFINFYKIFRIRSEKLAHSFHETFHHNIYVKGINANLIYLFIYFLEQLHILTDFSLQLFIFMGGMQVVEHLEDASVYSLPPVPLNVVFNWL